MPTLGSFTINHLHDVTAPSLQGLGSNLFTGNPVYSQLVVPFIRVLSLDNSDIFYRFDPFNPPSTSGGVIYCNVTFSLSHHGTFEFQIDDNAQTLDTDNITNGRRVHISLGKNTNNMFTHMSGMIRTTGYTRGCEQNLLYNVSGFGTGIRLNERILDVLMDQPITDEGDVHTTDPDFAANKVVDDAFDRTSYYPESIKSNEVEGTGGLGYVNSSGTVVDSPITDFIPGVVLRFGEIQDLMNQIEDYTGGRVYVDESDRVQFQPIKTPVSTNKGFKIVTNPILTSDFADTTMYVDAEQDYSYTDSISKDAGYSNSLYGILGQSVVPDKDSADSNDFLENKTVEIAFRFKPITNPHWRLYAGVEAVGMTNVNSENTVRGRWRICKDDGGIPMNTNGIIANKYMYPNKEYSTADGGVQTINIFGEGSNDLDENTWYWLILSSVNSTATEYWRWYYDGPNFTTPGPVTATAPPATSSSTDGGTGWTLAGDKKMELFQGRFKSEPQNILDVLAVRKRILIESVVPSFPQQIKSKRAAVKYLAGLIHFQARPRRIFDFPSLTIPNKPIFPGDIACIVDSRFNFSTPGNPVVGGQITDINYTMGSKGGGTSPLSKGQSNMSLSVVAYPGDY